MSACVAPKGSEIYESDHAVAEYLLFHYGTPDDVLGRMPGPRDAVGFATRLVNQLAAIHPETSRALDIGCAVGGSSFELSKTCAGVVGIDFSRAFIEAACRLRTTGSLRARKRIEGTRFADFEAIVPEDSRREVVEFEVGDACVLRDDLGQFDIVLAANLICRLPNPRAFLTRLPELVKSGGQLLLTTPFTWMDEYTAADQWLGATPDTGASFDCLRALLDGPFTLEHIEEIPFLIREHSRKFQYTVALGSRWRRV